MTVRASHMTREEYKKYLQTPHWHRVRKAALKRAKYRCQICNSAVKLQVHHRSYDNIGHELASDIIAICENCHMIFHQNGKLDT